MRNVFPFTTMRSSKRTALSGTLPLILCLGEELTSLQIALPVLMPDGRLWPFVETCCATWIMHFPEFVEDYGNTHVLVKHTLHVTRTFGLKYEQLHALADKMKTQWKLDNFEMVENAHVVEQLSSQVELLREENKELRGMMQKQEGVFRKLVDMQATLQASVIRLSDSITESTPMSAQ